MSCSSASLPSSFVPDYHHPVSLFTERDERAKRPPNFMSDVKKKKNPLQGQTKVMTFAPFCILLKNTKDETGKFYHDSRKTGWVTTNTASAWLGV